MKSDSASESAAAERRFVAEVKGTMAVSDFPIRAWPPDFDEQGDIAYFYKSGALLARDADAQRVAEAIRVLSQDFDVDGQRREARVDSPLKGVTRFQFDVPQLSDPSDIDQALRTDPTPRLIDRLEDTLGPGVASHEYAFEVTYVHCPATEPERVLDPDASQAEIDAALWPPRSPGDAGAGVHVSVVDTGLLNGVEGWAPWLAGVIPDSAADVEDPDTFDVHSRTNQPDGYADPYAGHGSFIAGIIRCIAPATDVVVERLLGPTGFVSEGDMITQVQQGLSRSPDIISLSAGGRTRGDVPPLGLQQLWSQRLSQQGGVVLVAAAGNNSSMRPFWPAAFDWCVAVGSMSRDGQDRSWFSNYGSWVDVFAPGEKIVNAYPKLKYKTIVENDVRDTRAGVVSWSGTSFATPIVSALIAARMSRTGENGPTAAAALLAAARGQFRPGVGPRLFP